jgi:hypothetical protein
MRRCLLDDYQIVILDSKDFGERRGQTLFLKVKRAPYIVGDGKVNTSIFNNESSMDYGKTKMDGS